MKDNWKRCLENCYPVLKNVPLRQTIPSMFHILVKSIMKKYKKVNSVTMKNPNNKKQILKVIPDDIWINHFTQVNKNNAGTQPTTHKEDRNNIHTNLSRNNSLQTNAYDYDLTDYHHPSKLPSLVDESRNAANLDSGASKTVCEKSWLHMKVRFSSKKVLLMKKNIKLPSHKVTTNINSVTVHML